MPTDDRIEQAAKGNDDPALAALLFDYGRYHPIHTWHMGAAWLCLHLWEHYQFSCDRDFLARRAYPLMKEAALFLTDFVIQAPPGVVAADAPSSPSLRSPTATSFRVPASTTCSC